MTQPTSRMRNSDLSERSRLLRKNQVHLHQQYSQDTPSINTIANEITEVRETPFRNAIQSGDELENSNTSVRHKQSFYRTCAKRFPKGKGVLLVIFIYFVESFAWYSTLNGLQQILFGDQPGSIWIFTFLEGTAGRIVYPVAGVIADTYLGRYQVVHIGLWLLWIGIGVLAFSQSLVIVVSHSVFVRYILPIVSTILISIGAGSVEVNTISFGVDQLTQGATSEEISSYFYWYYFNRNTGNLAATIVSLLLFGIPRSALADNSGGTLANTLYSIESILAMAAITVAMIAHYFLQQWYFKDRKRENPIKSIINVIYYSATVKRHPPIYRRAFRHGEEKKPRIELAKFDYDGIFPSEEVENVKTFCQISLLVFTLGGYFATYGAAYSMLSYQFNKTTIEVIGQDGAFLASNFLTLINVLTFIVLLPLLNYFLIPFLSGFSMRIRIGCGLICNFLCVAIAALLHLKQFNLTGSSQLGWLIMPAVLVSLGDALTVVTSVEFIYAQSPETMKGLLTGLLYLAYGIFRGGGIIFFHFYSYLILEDDHFIMYFYVMFTIIAALGLVMYVIIACLYRHRHRPTGDDSEEDLIRRAFAQNVFSQ